MSKHPLDDLLDSWMEMMQMSRRHMPQTPLYADKQDSVGDWEDRNGEISVTIDMPGVAKKDIELTVDEHTVSIEADNDARQYSISKTFDASLNPDKVTATLNNGILDIKIKKADSIGKTIKIK
jgi:HSP20 family molecular chaperone IbpA